MPTKTKSPDLATYLDACRVPGTSIHVVRERSGEWTVGDLDAPGKHGQILTVDGEWVKELRRADVYFPDAATAIAAALNHPRTGTPPKKAVQPADIDPTADEYLDVLQVGNLFVSRFRATRWSVGHIKDAKTVYLLGQDGKWDTGTLDGGPSDGVLDNEDQFLFPSAADAVAAALAHPWKKP